MCAAMLLAPTLASIRFKLSKFHRLCLLRNLRSASGRWPLPLVPTALHLPVRLLGR